MSLKLLVIGAGRDGTTSCTELVKKIFEKNDYLGNVFHQLDHNRLYNEYAKYIETGDDMHMDKIKKIIEGWDAEYAIVGNGYAHILELIYNIHGSDLILVHLKRNKSDWLKSFKQNVETFPKSHGNYIDVENPKIWRICAPYFNEMTLNEWLNLLLMEKLQWYYDKTHYLIEKNMYLFNKTLFIPTEELSTRGIITKLTKLISPDWEPPGESVFINTSKFDFRLMESSESKNIQRFYREFDFVDFSRNPVKGIEFFKDKVIIGYLNRSVYESNVFSKNVLEQLKKTISNALSEIEIVLKNH